MQASLSNYERYRQAVLNRPEAYPIGPVPDPERYRPLAAWLGRLVLPDIQDRVHVSGAWLEVQHAPPVHAALVGRRVRLRWAQSPEHHARLWGATRTVHFTAQANRALRGGKVLAKRLDGLAHVNPLESLAAAHPYDDVEVRLDGAVTVDLAPTDGGEPIVYAPREPVQVTGRWYALARFLGSADASGDYRVRHYDRAAGDFSGPEEVVRMPEVVANAFGVRNSTAAGIERSPLNADGWYLAGALDGSGRFVVRSLVPRALVRFGAPQATYEGVRWCMDYLGPSAWRRASRKGAATVALLCGAGLGAQAAREQWREGDEALLVHLYGGIGGAKAELAARSPLYWGHFAFGRATLVREPLSGDLVFDIVYHQVYAHNGDGITSGAMHYTRYAGDRQYGWAGVRPIQDILIKLDALTEPFELRGQPVTALDQIIKQLEVMAARYRIADGRGGTQITAINNCTQDAAQALYAAIRGTGRLLKGRPDLVAELAAAPGAAERLKRLGALGEALRHVLLPWGAARDDWEYGIALLGTGVGPIDTLGRAAVSWRTMLPSLAARALVRVFLEHGASAWALRSFQVGGHDPTIEPYLPTV